MCGKRARKAGPSQGLAGLRTVPYSRKRLPCGSHREGAAFCFDVAVDGFGLVHVLMFVHVSPLLRGELLGAVVAPKKKPGAMTGHDEVASLEIN
jgi:hypothetical protein